MQHQGDFIKILIEKSHYSHEEVAREIGISVDELHALLEFSNSDKAQLKAIYTFIKPATKAVREILKNLITKTEAYSKIGRFDDLQGTLSIFRKYQKETNSLSVESFIPSDESTEEVDSLIQKIKKDIGRINSQYDVFDLLGWLNTTDYFFLQISRFFYPIAIPPRVLMGLFIALFLFLSLSFWLVSTIKTGEKKSDKEEVSEKQQEYACHETVCLSCGKCFEVECFESALSCYDNQISLSTTDKMRQTECIKILRADSCFAAGKFKMALELYNELEDSVAIRYSKEKKALLIVLIAQKEHSKEYSLEEASTQIQQVDKTLQETEGELSEKAEESLKKLKKELEKELKSQWEGSWQQEQSGKNGVIKGLVTIKFDPDFSHGSFMDEFANNVRQEGELTELKFNQDATEISGNWYNKNTQLKGSFFLKFNATRDYFKGYYTMPNSDKEYYWNGYK